MALNAELVTLPHAWLQRAGWGTAAVGQAQPLLHAQNICPELCCIIEAS